MNISNFIAELKRRNVIKVATAYAIAGWLIIQIATSVFPAFNFPDWTQQFVIILTAIGFPISLIIAWAFELTPQGLKTTKEVDENESITHSTGKTLNGFIIACLSLVVVFLLFERFVLAPDSFAEDFAEYNIAENVITNASIAVLPFVDLSPDGDQEYFSDGISEEILNVLVKVNDIEVASRTSSFQFKGRELGIPEIANQLKVKHILEGSVRKSGETLRITAQLIEAHTDKHLWSETYDRPLTTNNIFDIQDEISRAIVDEMGVLIGATNIIAPSVNKTTDNLGAYELYLKARPYYLDRSRLDEADEFLIRAIELDPNYADAWEMRAALQMLIYDYGYSDEDSRDPLQEVGLTLAKKTLELNPNSSTAMATIGNIYFDRILENGSNIQQVFEYYKRALEIDPRNATAILWNSIALLAVGDVLQAEEGFKRCLELEPRYAPCYENYVVVLSINGNDQEALKAHYEGLNQGLIKVKYSNFSMLARLNEELAFKTGSNSEVVLLGWNRHDELWKAFQNLDADHTKLARDILNFIDNRSGIDQLTISTLTYPLGVFDEYFYGFMTWDPSYKKFRNSNKFKEYIVNSGIFNYWNENGFPEMCRPIGTNDFECE